MVRAVAGLALCAGLMGLAGALGGGESVAAEPPQPGYPSSLEREPLLSWLRRETDIQPERVVAVTPQSLTSVVSSFPAGGGQGPRAVIRAEALSPETVARTGSLSWHVSLTADCQGRRLKLGETTGYAQRNLLGEARRLRDADTDWRAPEAGTALEYAWRAVCEPDFRGPFASQTHATAPQAAAPQAPRAKPPAPTSTPAATPPSGRTAGLVAQVGASTSDAEAKGLLAALGGLAEGRRTWVEPAKVGGKTWYRAVVGGFADAADAQSFCTALKASGRACFIRKAM